MALLIAYYDSWDLKGNLKKSGTGHFLDIT